MKEGIFVNLDGLAQGQPVKAVKLVGYRGMAVYSAPSRGGDVQDVKVNGESVMMVNSRGHINGFEIDTFGLQMANWVEGLTTCGLDNVGGPTSAFSGHGTISHSPLTITECSETSVRGTICSINLVLGPIIEVQRTIIVAPDRYSFTVKDELEAGEISNGRRYEGESDYMLLYHPNFPIRDGDQLFANASRAVARDLIANCDADSFVTISGVGKGYAVFQPSQPGGDDFSDFSKVQEENFERCYVMQIDPAVDGNVYVALVAGDKARGSYIRYNLNQFRKPMTFQFWRNPRGGCAGLEIGSCFMGRDYAMKHGLMSRLKAGETHVYELEIGFLTSADEVYAFLEKAKIEFAQPEIVRAYPNNKEKGELYHKDLYKWYQ